MNRKILTFSIAAVFMFVAISFASAVNTTSAIEKKESPLYGIRLRHQIEVKIGEAIENIKAKYIGERVFFLPVQWLINIRNHPSGRFQLQEKSSFNPASTCLERAITCGSTVCPPC